MIEGLIIAQNDHASPGSKSAIARIAEAQHTKAVPLSRDLKFPKDTQVILVDGGDGSDHWVVNACTDQGINPLLLIYPGGSEVGFQKSVAHTGSSVSVDSLLNGVTLLDLQRKALEFAPAVVDMGNGSSRTVIHAASAWLVGERYAMYCEGLRASLKHPILAGRFRAGVASVLATLPYAHQLNFAEMEPALKHAQVGPYFGRILLCKEQDLRSNEIALVTLQGKSWREVFIKLSLLGIYALYNKPPHKSLVSVKPAISHFLERHPKVANANLDGDLHPLPAFQENPGPFEITRSDRRLRVLAVRPG